MDELLRLVGARVTVDGLFLLIIIGLVWEIRRVRASEAKWMRIALSALGVADKAVVELENRT